MYVKKSNCNITSSRVTMQKQSFYF